MTTHMDAPTAPDAFARSGSAPGQSPEAPLPPPAPRRASATILVLIFVGFISLGLPDGLLGVAWPSIRQTFGLPIDALGALFMTVVCGYLVASLTSGWMAQRLGVGMLLALSALATALSLLTFSLAPAWIAMIVVGVVAGLGGGAIDAGLNSYVALMHSPRLLSWLHACFGIGAAAGPAIMTTVLTSGQPWQVGYAIVGTGQLVLGLCFWLTRRQWQVEDPLPPAPPSSASEGTSRSLSAPVGSSPAAPAWDDVTASSVSPGGWLSFGPAVWLSIGLFVVYTGIETTAGQWTYTLFVEGRAIPAQAAGLGISAYWGALALGRVLAGLVANRIAPATLTRWSMAGMLAGALLVWSNAAVWLSFGGLVLAGLSAAPVFPSLIGVTPQRFGPARAATIIGFQVGAAALGIAGLPALAGVLATRLGLETIPLLMVVSALGMICLHEVVVRMAAREAAPGLAG